MSTTIAALKGKMGSSTYYLMYMSAQTLVNLARIPRPDEWEKLTIQERYQRELDHSRVRKAIVPYLIEDKDRFFGSIIVASDKWDDDGELNNVVSDVDNDDEGQKFEPLEEFLKKSIPRKYRSEAKQLGFYTFGGDENLVILDGQHRVQALKLAIEGDDSLDLGYNKDVAADMISVILIKHDPKKSRKIFTKINSNARKPSKAETLITDDDDVVAVLTREIANERFGDPRIVNLKTSQLSEKHLHFISLPTIANGVESLLTHTFHFTAADKKTRPDKDKENLYRTHVNSDWKKLLRKIELWHQALEDPSEDGDPARKQLRKDYLILRPMAMQAIFEVYASLTNIGPPIISPDKIISTINRLPWRTHSKLWAHVMFSAGKVQPKNYKLVVEILKYIIRNYECVSKDQEVKLLQAYRNVFPKEEQESVNLKSIKKYAERKGDM